jgi:siroheme synthase
MPFRHVEDIARQLMDHGMPPQTPGMCVSWLSYPQQALVTAPLWQLAEAVDQASLQPPSILVVGDVVGFWQRLRAQNEASEEV